MNEHRAVIERLKTIKDPEVDIDIWTLGLIYNIEKREEELHITMTLTSPLCPFAKSIPRTVKETLMPLTEAVHVHVVFDPPWEPNATLRARYGI